MSRFGIKLGYAFIADGTSQDGCRVSNCLRCCRDWIGALAECLAWRYFSNLFSSDVFLDMSLGMVEVSLFFVQVDWMMMEG